MKKIKAERSTKTQAREKKRKLAATEDDFEEEDI